jgi:cell division protein FtsL
MFLATLVAANSLATKGGDTGDVNAQIAKLQNENANLETQVASLTAVSRIYNEAKSRGYVEPDKVMYAAPASPVALSR